MAARRRNPPHSSPLLGEHPFVLKSFPRLDQVFQEFREPSFKKLNNRKRFGRVNQVLLDLLKKAPRVSFLLAGVVEYMKRVNDAKLLDEPYNISLFEFWLNHFSGLNDQENYEIRAKIMGKLLPRDDYQVFFPIGMNRTFFGTHFVTAHLSPDVDTMIASFWGWVDAFSARVGTGVHHWALPGGPPESPVTSLFRQILGDHAYEVLARTYVSLSLTALDLVTKKNLRKERGFTVISTLDHGRHEKAVILVDENEHFLGDWHTLDVEVVRQIVVLFKSCLHWFENNFYNKLVAFFAQSELTTDDIPHFLKSVFDVSIQDCAPARDFSQKQKDDLDAFLKTVLEVPNGIKGTFSDLSKALEDYSVNELTLFQDELNSLKKSDLFDRKGHLIEDRPKIFNRIERIIERLNSAILRIRDYAERLDVVIQTKEHVLNNSSDYVTLRTDVEVIRSKIKNESFITVVIPESNGELFPVGVVWANDLRKSTLGTVSLRDFCNPDEVKMASYLSVISVIDHHKTNLLTQSTPLALIGDAQSCNVLVAEQDLMMNQKIQGDSFVHPDREFVEYIFLLHAIMDDTDLLTKVSDRDVMCVVQLLNRLKVLQCGQSAPQVTLDDIPRDRFFAKNSAEHLLKNDDLYSLYRQIFAMREQEVEADLKQCLKDECTKLFADTKDQNGCCRVGQTKIFSSNYPTFAKAAARMQEYWVNHAQDVYRVHPEINLHLHMISTIASADEVHQGHLGEYKHQDELWIWIPETQKSYDHLASFLSSFQSAPEVADNPMTLELPEGSPHLQELFLRNFKGVETISKKGKNTKGPHLATLRFKAGSINSRKSMITPYLPRPIV